MIFIIYLIITAVFYYFWVEQSMDIADICPLWVSVVHWVYGTFLPGWVVIRCLHQIFL